MVNLLFRNITLSVSGVECPYIIHIHIIYFIIYTYTAYSFPIHGRLGHREDQHQHLMLMRHKLSASS